MQDNTKRGERTLFWLKVLFVLFIFLFFANNTFGESMKSMRQESVGLAVAYIAYGFVCGFGLLISSVMFLVYYFSWLHRAIANLRILTKPDFSPIGAIVLTLIPIIGFVLHFWIFNDMVGCQEKCMEGCLSVTLPFASGGQVFTLKDQDTGEMLSGSAGDFILRFSHPRQARLLWISASRP